MIAGNEQARSTLPALRAVVADAYQVFAGYRRSKPINVCRCPSCVSPEAEQLLGSFRCDEMPASVLAAYTNSAHGYDPAMDGDTFRHFLPRYFDLIAGEDAPDGFGEVHFCLSRLALTGFRAEWPTAEVTVIDRFFDAVILDALSDGRVCRLPAGYQPLRRASDLFVMATTAGGSVDRLVALIPQAPDPACAVQMAALAQYLAYEQGEYVFKSPLIDADTPLARALGAAVATPEMLRRLEQSFLNDPAEGIQDILARGIDHLSAWLDGA